MIQKIKNIEKKNKMHNFCIRWKNKDKINNENNKILTYYSTEDGDESEKEKSTFVKVVEKWQDSRTETIGLYVLYAEIFSRKIF